MGLKKTSFKGNIPEVRSLEVSSKDIHLWMKKTLKYVVPYLESMERIPMKDLKGIEKFKKLREPIPKKGRSIDVLLKTIFDDLLVKGIQVPSPGYLAYIPVGSIFHSTLAEFITHAINRWAGLYQYAPGFLEIENTVVAWLCEIVGLPKGSGGVLTSGGSMANLGAIVTARHTQLGEDFLKGVIYFSKDAHHSVGKSARLVGFPKKNLRQIGMDSEFRMSISELNRAIHEDKSKGLTPFLVIGTAGTTGTGAIDDLQALSQICKKEKMWFHVDAAWAGSLRLTKTGKEILADTSYADSVTFDPHKALYTPFGCGALLVRNPRHLRDAHSFEAAYLPGENEEETLLSPAKLSPELSRNIRGLQVWLPFQMLGIGPFVETLEEKVRLVQWATEELKMIEGIRIVFEPQTAIVGFNFYLPNKTQQELNAMNKEMLDRINSHQKILLSSIEIEGSFVIRIIPFGQRTHFKHVKLTIDYIKSAAKFCKTKFGSFPAQNPRK